MPGIAVEMMVASIATIAIAAMIAAITRGRRVVREVVMRSFVGQGRGRLPQLNRSTRKARGARRRPDPRNRGAGSTYSA